jgi:L-lactate utilization protein LutB
MPYKDPQKKKEAQRRHYQRNRAKYVDGLKERRMRNKEYAWERKLKCVTCGETDQTCLDFHHLGDKVETIANMIRQAVSISKLQQEIDKCEVLCGNCHRRHHHSETDRFSDYSNQARVDKLNWFREYLSRQSCVECGLDDHRCIEFHHVGDKNFHISYINKSGHSLSSLQDELKLCQSLCVNCHRKTHVTTNPRSPPWFGGSC